MSIMWCVEGVDSVSGGYCVVRVRVDNVSVVCVIVVLCILGTCMNSVTDIRKGFFGGWYYIFSMH